MAFPSTFKTPVITTTLLTTLLLFLLHHHHHHHHHHPPPPSTTQRSLLSTTTTNTTTTTTTTTPCPPIFLLNYPIIHHCLFNKNPFLSIPFLTLLLLLHFYILVKTAQDYFSIAVTKISNTHLKLSPSMGAVTLLALGNGAPDVFASVAAVSSGNPRTGFGAILSAGTFVSAFVVGFVAIYAAPFGVDPGSFVRDVLFYLIAAMFLFWVYLSGEIFVWQAIGFIGFYLFFVGVVFWMDFKVDRKVDDVGIERGLENCENGGVLGDFKSGKSGSWFGIILGKVAKLWEIPVSVLLKLTIPQTSPNEWSRFYSSANIALCPVILLYSFVPLDQSIVFLLPNTHFPLGFIVLFACTSLALLHYTLEQSPPETEHILIVLATFIMSVFWISTTAGELLSCLSALGHLLEVSPAFLGLTVLAWGNSVGDLVADVALARAGQPALAMAGCFACPMFNMLFGLGIALVIQTANVYPKAYELEFHLSIVVAFVFLILSLMGSVLVVTWCRFRVPRFWGFCLVGLYVFFMFVSLVIAKFSV